MFDLPNRGRRVACGSSVPNRANLVRLAPMDIYLVRHGEAAQKWWQSMDPGLSDLGRNQARQAAKTLLPLLQSQNLSGSNALVRLVASPLLRARETAVPLADALGCSAEVDAAYREIPSPGPFSERQDWLNSFMHQRWDEQPEAVRKWREASIAGLHATRQTTVVFTHFVVVNAVVGQITGEPQTLCCWPANASITHLRLVEGSLQLVQLGEQIHGKVN